MSDNVEAICLLNRIDDKKWLTYVKGTSLKLTDKIINVTGVNDMIMSH